MNAHGGLGLPLSRHAVVCLSSQAMIRLNM